MSSRLLKRCGEALYGPRWQSEMARDLDVSDRTMRRWIAGEPPQGVYRDLGDLCRRRMKEIATIVAELPR